jgi:hypothetical protein
VKKDDLWNDGMDIPDWLKTNITPPAEKKPKDDFWTLESDKDDTNEEK